MGAMASKNESPPSPSCRVMEEERESDVRGPVATMAGPEGKLLHLTPDQGNALVFGHRLGHSPGQTGLRSTANADPAATLVDAATLRSREPSAIISLFNWPWAFRGSSLLKELVQTSSPRSPLRWAGVGFSGLIS